MNIVFIRITNNLCSKLEYGSYLQSKKLFLFINFCAYSMWYSQHTSTGPSVTAVTMHVGTLAQLVVGFLKCLFECWVCSSDAFDQTLVILNIMEEFIAAGVILRWKINFSGSIKPSIIHPVIHYIMSYITNHKLLTDLHSHNLAKQSVWSTLYSTTWDGGW